MSDTDPPTSPGPNPSLSRNLEPSSSSPPLVHSLHELRSSVLSLAASDEYIFSGSQNEDIAVWCKSTFRLKETLRGHTGSVLALEYARERVWLFSSSGDSTVRIWSTRTLAALYTLSPFGDTESGDLFSLAWVPSLETIYIGCQNTSLQWFSFANPSSDPPSTEITGGAPDLQRTQSSSSVSGSSTPRKAQTPHKFFDSYPRYQRRPADMFARNGPAADLPGTPDDAEHGALSIPPENVHDSAHFGYVYCMTLVHDHDHGSDGEGRTLLVTGSGDEVVKVWTLSPDGPQFLHEFACSQGALLAFVARPETSTVYAACQDGYVKVLDLETRSVVRSVMVDEGVDILSMSMLGKDLFTCSANGRVHRWSSSTFDCTASWKAHSGIVLSSIVTKQERDSAYRLVTGGNDNYINVWDLHSDESVNGASSESEGLDALALSGRSSSDTLVHALTKFVSIPSVSSLPRHREDCRQCAIWLKKCLNQLSARSSLLSTGDGKNPLVLAEFVGTKTEQGKKRRRVLFYGHYDVISAPSSSSWSSDPFTLTGRNGYLYGRGATDDKGPIVAVAMACADLLRARRLVNVDVVFLVEGEEENGSGGFEESVRRYKEMVGDVDVILVSNSTWIAEDPPCITYGLRGVVHCALSIKSNFPDLHSGIEGGAVREPMIDMVKLLGMLTDKDNKVCIPGFYDHVRPQSGEEKTLYEKLSALVQRPASVLSSRWREPSLTVHAVQISGPSNSTVIPGSVNAQISLRLVPDQSLDDIVKSLTDFLRASFAELRSSNTLDVLVEHKADWWLGNLEDRWFRALEDAVKDEWGVEPLRIREGGSIPSVPFLEKVFGCHALHLPMGQSSDQAHLPNERISLINLHRGKAVIERFLLNVAERCN